MTTYANIRKRVIERMGEYHGGAAEVAAAASMSGQTLYDRMTTVLRSMFDVIQKKDPAKLVATAALTYTAQTESMALPAAALYRPITTIERQISAASTFRYDGLREIDLEQMQQAARWGELPLDNDDAPMTGYGYYVEGQATLYVVPIPGADLTLRIRYIAGQADLVDVTDDANSPNLIPSEHQDLIALEAALSFLRETDNPATLEREKADKWRAFVEWASTSPKAGRPRYVRSV